MTFSVSFVKSRELSHRLSVKRANYVTCLYTKKLKFVTFLPNVKVVEITYNKKLAEIC